MSELEMEIGRTLGASCFFIYQTVKHNPNVTAKELECETGLSKTCIDNSLRKLYETGVLERKMPEKGPAPRPYLYKENDRKETWKFH